MQNNIYIVICPDSTFTAWTSLKKLCNQYNLSYDYSRKLKYPKKMKGYIIYKLFINRIDNY